MPYMRLHTSTLTNTGVRKDWFFVSSVFIQFSGASLLKQHNYSLINVMRSIYPNHEWQAWKFVHSSRNFWKAKENVGDFIKHLRQLKDWKDMDDLYKITVEDFRSNGGAPP